MNNYWYRLVSQKNGWNAFGEVSDFFVIIDILELDLITTFIYVLLANFCPCSKREVIWGRGSFRGYSPDFWDLGGC